MTNEWLVRKTVGTKDDPLVTVVSKCATRLKAESKRTSSAIARQLFELVGELLGVVGDRLGEDRDPDDNEEPTPLDEPLFGQEPVATHPSAKVSFLPRLPWEPQPRPTMGKISEMRPRHGIVPAAGYLRRAAVAVMDGDGLPIPPIPPGGSADDNGTGF